MFRLRERLLGAALDGRSGRLNTWGVVMAEDDRSGPIRGPLAGEALTGREPAFKGAGAGHSARPALRPMYETPLARSAGRMVTGTSMAVPGLGGHTSGRSLVPAVVIETATRKPGLPRTAIAAICAVTLGSTAALIGVFGTGGPSDLSQAGEPGTGTLQVLAVASPMAVAPPQSPGSDSAIIRVAQRDAVALQAANVFGPAGKPLGLTISLTGARAEDYSFLMFRGLPPGVTLSAGFRLKESWAVSLRDLDNLMIEAPADFQGAFNLEILLIKGRDTPAESRVITVQIVPSDIQLPAATAGLGQPLPMQAAPGPQVLTAAPRTPDAERPVQRRQQPAAASRLTIPASEEAMMMQRAEILLQNKDVSSARLLFEHLAKNGSARAALAMGKTYDPAFLGSIEAAGLKPNVEKARNWYKQAAELGDQEAQGRLSSLASR
jgi:hypothetical protein